MGRKFTAGCSRWGVDRSRNDHVILKWVWSCSGGKLAGKGDKFERCESGFVRSCGGEEWWSCGGDWAEESGEREPATEMQWFCHYRWKRFRLLFIKLFSSNIL